MDDPENPAALHIPQALISRWRDLLDTTTGIVEARLGRIARISGDEMEALLLSGAEAGKPGSSQALGLYCRQAAHGRDVLMIAAASAHSSGKDGSGTAQGPASYLGLPIRWPDGNAFGAIDFTDFAPGRHAGMHRRLIEQVRDVVEDGLAQIVAEDRRARADARLSIERDRLLLAAAAGHAGVWDYHIDADTLHCDARWYEILGLDPAVPVKSIDDFRPYIHPEDVARATEVNLATLSDLLARKQDYHVSFRIIRPDGEIRWLRSVACLMKASSGLPDRAVGFVVDITEPHLAKEQLQQSLASLRQAEARLQELNATLELRIKERTREYNRVWTHSRDLQIVIGADGIFRAVSPAWTRVLGHAPEDVVGHSFLEFLPPEDAQSSQNVLDSAAAGADLTNFENRVFCKDGSLRWISWHTSVEEDLVYAYGRDITLEKAAGDALEQSEARLRSVFETSYQYQSLLTPEGILVDSNSTSLRGIGARLEDVAGRPFWETPWFTGTEGMPAIVRDAVRRAAAGEHLRREIELVLPETGRRCFDFTLRPIRSGPGAMDAIVHEAVDLTDRHQAEAALRQSQKMEAVGHLASGIAHDFNNLLQGIVNPINLAQALIARGQPDEAGRMLANALASVTRASVLTRRLLTFSRKQPLDSRPVDAGRMVASMTELIRQSIGPAIAIEVTGGAVWQTATDANQFENALLNLCINARDAMPDGGKVTLETANAALDAAAAARLRLAPGDYVCLCVSDTGSGMTRDVLERAFDPFFTTKPPGQGTGLGLYMIYEFARSCGGQVHIDSEVGRGTTVRLYMPRHVDGAHRPAG